MMMFAGMMILGVGAVVFVVAQAAISESKRQKAERIIFFDVFILLFLNGVLKLLERVHPGDGVDEIGK